MGTDSKLYNIKTKQKIDCDRIRNIDNAILEKSGLREYLFYKGLPKFMIVDLLEEMENMILFHNVNSYRKQILEDLEQFDDYDYFILIDDQDDRYFED